MKSLLPILLFLFFACQEKHQTTAPIVHTIATEQTINVNERLKQKAAEASVFCKKENFDAVHCLLMDTKVHSGKNRLFLWDFKKSKVIEEGLVSHGCCGHPWGGTETKTAVQFSNVSESHCSSVGKFALQDRGYSNWGINVNYKLHGLDSTNSHAFKRTIVFHSWEMVGEKETYPEGTPEGWGCPAVSNEFLRKLDPILKKKKKKVLFWIYE